MEHCEEVRTTEPGDRSSFPPTILGVSKKNIPFSKTCFQAAIPNNWRLYKMALNGYLESELSIRSTGIGPICNGQAEDLDTPGITWLELALDFFAATHCALAMPDEIQDSRTAAQRAHFFNSASRRMQKSVYNGTLTPGEHLTHVPILTSIGMGRASGFSIRPFLMCPEVCACMSFSDGNDHKCNIGQNFNSYHCCLLYQRHPRYALDLQVSNRQSQTSQNHHSSVN